MNHHSIFLLEETYVRSPQFLQRRWVLQDSSEYMSLLIHQPTTNVNGHWDPSTNQSIHFVIFSRLVLVVRLVMSLW